MRGHDGQTKWAATNQLSGRGIVVWIRSYIEPDLLDNNVPFDNTTLIYLINLLWKLELGLEINLQLHYFRIFRVTTAKRTHPNDQQQNGIEYVILFCDNRLGEFI